MSEVSYIIVSQSQGYWDDSDEYRQSISKAMEKDDGTFVRTCSKDDYVHIRNYCRTKNMCAIALESPSREFNLGLEHYISTQLEKERKAAAARAEAEEKRKAQAAEKKRLKQLADAEKAAKQKEKELENARLLLKREGFKIEPVV